MAETDRHGSNPRAESSWRRPKKAVSFLACHVPSSRQVWLIVQFRWKKWLKQSWRPHMAKVLIVDDSAMSRRMLRRILEEAGHKVTEAEDGMVAIEKYFLDKPDVVLLDLIMRGMFGMEVLQKIRQIDERARVVVASADIQTSTRAMTEAEGALGFVTKPFVEKEIIAAVDLALKER